MRRALALAAALAALPGCWSVACVEPTGGALMRCWETVDGILFQEERDLDGDGLADHPECDGEWNDFSSCGGLGYTAHCPGSDYRVLPGQASYACL
ncbi:MAG: hypothetical protein U0229_09075 [Anaeromyxobacter sp.]